MKVNNVNRALVRIAKEYEFCLGSLTGDHHLTVSEAMKRDLFNQFRIQVVDRERISVMYDRATPKFLDIKFDTNKRALFLQKVGLE